jgi:hypothetical protein
VAAIHKYRSNQIAQFLSPSLNFSTPKLAGKATGTRRRTNGKVKA